jgi:hypothetical protein
MTHCLVNHHITGHVVFVLVSSERVMIHPAIDNTTSCEICFVHANNVSSAEMQTEEVMGLSVFWTLSIVLSLSQTPSCLFFKTTFRRLDSISVFK